MPRCRFLDRKRMVFALAALTSIGSILPCGVASGQGGDAAVEQTIQKLDETRNMFQRYFETEKLISKEQADWKLSKQILEDRIDLMKNQIAELREKTQKENETITEADTEREKLQIEADEQGVILRVQEEKVAELERRVLQLAPVVPANLKSKVQILLDRIPDPSLKKEEIRATVSQRYQNVLGILNEFNKFHGDITVANERRQLAGREAEVQTMYLGLAQAYYVGAGDKPAEAGRGHAGLEGWEWEDRADLAPDIQKVVNMIGSSTVAEFIELPVTISGGK